MPVSRFTKLLFSLLLFSFLGFPGPFSARAQSTYDQQVHDYIEQYKAMAIMDMRTYGIPASIKLAQGILESRAGQSPLAKQANNHFGIKCHTGWMGETYYMDDDSPNECFRKYKDAATSYHDHSEFLANRERYKFLFSIDVQNYQAWAYGLRTAGYATNPKYPDLLISLIERYSLSQYDLPEGAVIAVETTGADASLMEAYKSLFTYFAPGPNSRKIYINNHLQCTFALEDDNLLKIARDFHVKAGDLMIYNDLKRAGGLQPGQVVYLEKKKRKAVQKVHVVGTNQTMWEISQVYGVKLDILCRKNNLPANFEPPAGKVLKLR